MKATLPQPRVFEFYFQDVDTLVQVEDGDETVVIRATRHSFSERRKAFFIRQLAAEGFIPHSCQWLSAQAAPSSPGVRWLVDFSWVELPKAALTEARRFMVRLLAGAALLWLALMLAVMLH
jgi:hypothetical protein